MIDTTSVVRKTTRQISCQLTGEAAILNLESGIYYGLDEVGARVWALVNEPKRVEQVRDAIVEEFDVEAERCERDLLALFTSLADAGLVEIENA
jgi:hypothetical protein